MKKRIIVNAKNEIKIQNEIDAVQKRCTARTIDVDTINYWIKYIDREYPCTKKSLEGCRFCVNNGAQNFPNAYKYTPESTWFDLLRENGKWYLVNVYRNICGNKYIVADLSTEARQSIIDRFITVKC